MDQDNMQYLFPVFYFRDENYYDEYCDAYYLDTESGRPCVTTTVAHLGHLGGAAKTEELRRFAPVSWKKLNSAWRTAMRQAGENHWPADKLERLRLIGTLNSLNWQQFIENP